MGVIEDLRHLSRAEHVNWIEADAWAVDAIRGSVTETGWRGTLVEYFNDNPIQPMAMRAIERLTANHDAERRYAAMVPDWGITPDLRLGCIGLGTYGWKYDLEIIDRAVDGGIGFIDTAETYGYGKVETALGIAFAGYTCTPVVASKVARNHLSYQSVKNACGRSLERMNLAHLDLYQVHKPNPKYPIGDTIQAMAELVEAGLVRHVGVCNCSADQLWTAQLAFEPHRIATIQVRYNLMDRGIERALLPYCQKVGMTIIAYSPLGQNFRALLKADVNGVLKDVARRYSATEAQVALAWLMSMEGVIPIPRTNDLAHVDEILDVPGLVLECTDLELLDAEFPIKE